jgi:hypothetical protein
MSGPGVRAITTTAMVKGRRTAGSCVAAEPAPNSSRAYGPERNVGLLAFQFKGLAIWARLPATVLTAWYDHSDRPTVYKRATKRVASSVTILKICFSFSDGDAAIEIGVQGNRSTCSDAKP